MPGNILNTTYRSIHKPYFRLEISGEHHPGSYTQLEFRAEVVGFLFRCLGSTPALMLGSNRLNGLIYTRKLLKVRLSDLRVSEV